MGKKLGPALVAGLLCLLTACSEQGAPSADGQSNEPPATTDAATESTAAPAECPAGSYEVGSITAKDSVDVGGQQVQVAEVTGLTLEFTEDGGWTLAGDGATVSISAGGLSASATMDGTASGTYTKSGDQYAFTQDAAQGRITLASPVAGVDSIPMSDFGPAIAPNGTATITCTDTGLTLTAENATLELTGGAGGGTSGDTGSAPAPGAEPPGGGDPAPALINASGQTASYSCSGSPVTINGSDNHFTFTGACPALNVNGDSNEITVANVRALNVNGSQNRLTWTGKEPVVNNNGSGNSISQG